MSNDKSYLYLDIIILMICLLIIGFMGHEHIKKQQEQVSYLNGEVNREISSYDKVANKNDKQLASKIKYKTNPNKASWDLYTINQDRLNSVTQKFFSVYYNWDSDKMVQQRPSKMTKLATQKCLKASSLFGYSLSGDNNKVTSSLGTVDNYVYAHNNHYIRAITDVVYHAKIKGLTPNTGEKWYLITYDKKTDKLVNIIPFYRNVNTNQNIDAIRN